MYNGAKTRGVAASKEANRENMAPSSFEGVTFDNADLIVIPGVELNKPIAAPENTFHILQKKIVDQCFSRHENLKFLIKTILFFLPRYIIQVLDAKA